MNRVDAPSLLWRIVVRLALTTLAAIVLSYSWLWWKFDTTTAALRNRNLAAEAAMLAKGLSSAPDGSVALSLPAAMRAAYENSRGDHRFGVRDGGSGQVLFAAGGAVGAAPDLADGAETPYQYDPDGPGPTHMFGVARATEVAGRPMVVQVEQSGRDYEALSRALMQEFVADGGWLGAPFLVALMGVSIYTVRRSLRPLRALSEQAEAIGPSSTDVRLPEAGVPGEILPLVRAVNLALERLEDGFRIQREFTADAAHELRTPLAVLAAHIDTLPDAGMARSLRRDLDAMARLVNQLLRVAQVDALTISTQDHADLNALAVDVGTFLAPMALSRRRLIEVVECPAEPVVHGNTEALFNALRNLVENALAHTPADTTVTVTVTDVPSIQVRDHGPGVPAAMRERIFQRFWRSERRKTGGAGLGLAIVKRTMEMHGGDVRVEDAEGGGAVFTLEFH